MDPAEFYAKVWAPLCNRFAHNANDADEASNYLDYLSPRLTEDQIHQGARSLWATERFFPRPVDFIVAAYAGLLPLLRSVALEWKADLRIDWVTKVGGRDSIGLTVVQALGGIATVADLLDRGPRTVREEFEAVLTDILANDAGHGPGPRFGATEQKKLPRAMNDLTRAVASHQHLIVGSREVES